MRRDRVRDQTAQRMERIRQGGVRALILDIELPNGQDVAAFEGLLHAAPHIPILILSGMENESVARQAVERGAQDYILKSQLQTSRLRTSVHRMIERNTAKEKAFLQQQCVELTLSCTGDAVLIGDSAGRGDAFESGRRIVDRLVPGGGEGPHRRRSVRGC